MAKRHEQSIAGKFQHVIYSPKGGIEGVLLDVDRKPLQIVFERRDSQSPDAFQGLKRGQRLIIDAAPQRPSSKGASEHPVYDYVRLVSIDGRKRVQSRQAARSGYSGVVARLNYARHGAANGVVLDTGDFIHTKAAGLLRLQLKVGDPVTADGDACTLVTGRGRVIEAIRVNGRSVKPH
jgi:hypothetical protein